MQRSDREADLARLLIGGMIGAVAGALVGFVLFGGWLFVPALFMGAGLWIGVSRATGQEMPRPSVAMPSMPSMPSRPRRRRRRRGRSSPRTEPVLAELPARRSSPSLSPREPIDLNRADEEQLSLLPGVGRGAARRIIEYRDAHGPFRAFADLEAIDRFDAARVRHLATRAVLSQPEADEAAA